MKSKTVFVCKQCGNETPRWQGQCPACGAWNSIVEFEDKKAPAAKAAGRAGIARAVPKKLKEVTGEQEIRFSTGMQELDRVLGGGGVRGSLILVGGAPGIGKSTLLLQICAYLGKTLRILYVSGEESEKQIKMRADRLQVASDELYILSETDLSEILSAVDEVQPDILIADSIQTLYSPENTSAPGSISQVKDCTMALMQLAKSSGVARRCSNTWLTVNFFLRASTPAATAFCARLKTALARQTRSACSRWRAEDCSRFRTPRKCCLPGGH